MIVRTTGAGQVTTQGQQVIRQAGVSTMSGQVIRTGEQEDGGLQVTGLLLERIYVLSGPEAKGRTRNIH